MRQLAYLEVHVHACVFNPVCNSYNKSSIIACHRKNEKKKRRQYEETICNIEHGSFTPLVSPQLKEWVHLPLLFIHHCHQDCHAQAPLCVSYMYI